MARASGTIQNDDLPTLSIDDVSATEGDSGTETFTFHVTLSAPAPAAPSPSTSPPPMGREDRNRGREESDYVARSIIGQTIAAGSSSFNFDVTVNGDMNIEPNRNILR